MSDLDMCICGHVAVDHSRRVSGWGGCGYMHKDADGKYTVRCPAFIPAVPAEDPFKGLPNARDEENERF